MDESIIDFQRRKRLGVIEAIWGEHKSIKQISDILKKYSFMIFSYAPPNTWMLSNKQIGDACPTLIT